MNVEIEIEKVMVEKTVVTVVLDAREADILSKVINTLDWSTLPGDVEAFVIDLWESLPELDVSPYEYIFREAELSK